MDAYDLDCGVYSILIHRGQHLRRNLLVVTDVNILKSHVPSLSLLCLDFFVFCCRFLLPASLIVVNDIFAYICGFFFGRTPLIKLSPKKTWEGFIGASITTMISAFLVG